MKHLFSVISVIIIAGLTRTEPASARELLSIQGIAVPRNGFISAFHVDTFGVRVLAVCRLPPGWTIQAGSTLDLFGTLDGTSGGGAANLNGTDAHELNDIYLVDFLGRLPYDRNGLATTHPTSFTGKVTLGLYGDDDKAHDVKLRPANFILRPTYQCPPL